MGVVRMEGARMEGQVRMAILAPARKNDFWEKSRPSLSGGSDSKNEQRMLSSRDGRKNE